MKQTEEVLINVKAVYGELFPYRDPKAMRIDDSVLAAVVYLCREMELVRKTRVIESAFAEGAERQPSARKRGRASTDE